MPSRTARAGRWNSSSQLESTIDGNSSTCLVHGFSLYHRFLEKSREAVTSKSPDLSGDRRRRLTIATSCNVSSERALNDHPRAVFSSRGDRGFPQECRRKIASSREIQDELRRRSRSNRARGRTRRGEGKSVAVRSDGEAGGKAEIRQNLRTVRADEPKRTPRAGDLPPSMPRRRSRSRWCQPRTREEAEIVIENLKSVRSNAL